MDSREHGIITHTPMQSFTESWFYAIDLVIAYRIFWGSAWCWPSNWDTSNGIYSDGRTSTIPNVPPYYAPREMRAFYVIEFGFYSSQLLSVLTKSKKKDFAQMVIHHMLTALLIALSYTIGALRVGALPLATACHTTACSFNIFRDRHAHAYTHSAATSASRSCSVVALGAAPDSLP
jgi:hypothetical protein